MNYKETSTAGDMELGPLDEKYATCGDAHFPVTVFGNFSFAVGDLHRQVYEELNHMTQADWWGTVQK